MNIHFEIPNLEKLAAEFSATPKQMERAMRRAVVRTTRWAHTTSFRTVAKATGINVKLIQGRTAVAIHDSKGRIFIGLNPISLSRLNPVQGKVGIKAGPANVPGAFLTENFGKVVFKRVGDSRLPITKQTYGIAETAETALRREVISKLAAKLQAEFEHEFLWETRSHQA